jgi:hypothetical protein
VIHERLRRSGPDGDVEEYVRRTRFSAPLSSTADERAYSLVARADDTELVCARADPATDLGDPNRGMSQLQDQVLELGTESGSGPRHRLDSYREPPPRLARLRAGFIK